MEKKITYQEFSDAMAVVKKYKDQHLENLNFIESEIINITRFDIDFNKETLLTDTNLSVMLYNNLKYYFWEHEIRQPKVGDIQNLSIQEFMLQRNVGKKSLSELRDFCFSAGIIPSR